MRAMVYGKAIECNGCDGKGLKGGSELQHFFFPCWQPFVEVTSHLPRFPSPISTLSALSYMLTPSFCACSAFLVVCFSAVSMCMWCACLGG
jgi:hypothetical protein